MTTLFNDAEIATILPAQTAQPKKHNLVPVLIVLFLISYGLMTLLIVEQGRTIESQRALIHELFHDSEQLAAMKSRALQDSAASTQAQATQIQSTQTPSTQAQATAPSTHVPVTHVPSTQTPSTQAVSWLVPAYEMLVCKTLMQKCQSRWFRFRRGRPPI